LRETPRILNTEHRTPNTAKRGASTATPAIGSPSGPLSAAGDGKP
jgi:hypothetical protein